MTKPPCKIFATSVERYYGGAKEKRLYGGAGTVTRFLVGCEGSEASTWLKLEGHGASPAARKAYAIAQFKAKQGLAGAGRRRPRRRR